MNLIFKKNNRSVNLKQKIGGWVDLVIQENQERAKVIFSDFEPQDLIELGSALVSNGIHQLKKSEKVNQDSYFEEAP